MDNIETQIQEMLDICHYLGPGPLYLLYYYDQLAVTNFTGLMYWPEGPKTVLALIKTRECLFGFSRARKAYLLEKLRSLKISEENSDTWPGL